MSVADWLDKPVHISRGRVFFGDTELPGVIAEDGVRIHAGGAGEYNTMTIEFIVGSVEVDDSSLIAPPWEISEGSWRVDDAAPLFKCTTPSCDCHLDDRYDSTGSVSG
ncbi:hypothetical protein PBI_GAIA_175 [Mycobacterium phage Gaia]|uniref:Uncharacterized protein n=1 Tax=Mycobacterium phage Gaia TaxID=1486472 RepID=A0A068F4U1_9CAUD|nr:hypothetical protein VC46_gp061 [Mycobacterium phage Gaia]AID58991.1 hypothetical protein PBI_GAIA_175 [Mycobacterium phage Gaia]